MWHDIRRSATPNLICASLRQAVVSTRARPDPPGPGFSGAYKVSGGLHGVGGDLWDAIRDVTPKLSGDKCRYLTTAIVMCYLFFSLNTRA